MSDYRISTSIIAVLRGSLGIAHVQLSCVTDVGLVCVVERCDLTELKEVLLLLLLLLMICFIKALKSGIIAYR